MGAVEHDLCQSQIHPNVIIAPSVGQADAFNCLACLQLQSGV
jgi:hypothetical protein